MRDEHGLSELDTHAAWCNQLQHQSNWGAGFDQEYHIATEISVASKLAFNLAKRVNYHHDGNILEAKMRNVVYSWNKYPAMPADLILHTAFKREATCSFRVVWLLQRLVGPAILTLRPSVWRKAALFVLFKGKGVDSSLLVSFHMLFVKVQMGLLQRQL